MDDEKQAIETYKKFLDDMSKNGGCTIDIDFQHKEEYEAMWRVLNLIEKRQRQIEIKDKYLELMWFLGADYDGWDTVDGLKSLIDDLMNLVKKAGNNDDKYAVYEGGNDKYFNILYEEVKKEEAKSG